MSSVEKTVALHVCKGLTSPWTDLLYLHELDISSEMFVVEFNQLYSSRTTFSRL